MSQGLSCEVCKFKCHKRCASKTLNNCKWTSLASMGGEIIEESDGVRKSLKKIMFIYKCVHFYEKAIFMGELSMGQKESLFQILFLLIENFSFLFKIFFDVFFLIIRKFQYVWICKFYRSKTCCNFANRRYR